MIWVFTIIFSAYFLCMLVLVYGFRKVPIFSSEITQNKTRFSVIIPFRNEAENLPNLLRSINLLQYPAEMFEVIFINDASEDASEAIILKNNKKTAGFQ